VWRELTGKSRRIRFPFVRALCGNAAFMSPGGSRHARCNLKAENLDEFRYMINIGCRMNFVFL